MPANILALSQVMLELTAGFTHLDYFVRWSYNYDVKPMPNCKGSRQFQLRVTDRFNLLRGMYMFRQHIHMQG